MLASRLQCAQLDLQSHRKWLTTFVTATRKSSNRLNTSLRTSKTFASSSWRGQVQAPASKHQTTTKKSRAVWKRTQTPRDVRHDHINLDLLSTRDDLAKAIDAYDVKRVIALYGKLPSKKPLIPKDTNALAQCVHQCLRQELYKPEASRRREDINEIVSFANKLVNDIRRGRLQPNKLAHVHLLGVFKESGTRDAGIEFWLWLENQDNDYVNLDVYAVAIDLLAINGSSLEALEELYENALSRFPGTFFAYHLSPGAILSDRDQELDIKGIPMSLLQSITIARLLRGNSHKAYLALDTAFRLFPTSVNQRFFNTFQDERPVSESYTLFAIACRGGMQTSSSQFKGLLAKLRSCSDLESTTAHIVSLRVILAAIYLQLGSSGTLTSNSISELIITLTQLFRLPGVGAMDKNERMKIVEAVLATIRKTMAVFARYSVLPTVSSFNSIVTNVAGYGRAKEVLGIVNADMKALSLEPNDVTRRSSLTAAGLLKDCGLVNKFWKDIVDARKEQSSVPDGFDMHVLVKAARYVGKDDFARAAWDTYKEHIHIKHFASIERQFAQPLEDIDLAQNPEATSAKEILDGIHVFQSDLAFIDEYTTHQPAVQDYENQDLPITLLPMPSQYAIPEAEMRRLYDDLTSEPHPPNTTKRSEIQDDDTSLREFEGLPATSLAHDEPIVAKPAATLPSDLKLSATNISFGQLRYENWKAFNYLLWLAEQHDQRYDEVVDEAIISGAKPPERNLGFTKDEIEAMKTFGLSARVEADQRSRRKANAGNLADARAEILRLRDMTR